MSSFKLSPDLHGLYGRHQKRPIYSYLSFMYFAIPPWAKKLARKAANSGRRAQLIQGYLERLQDLPEAGSERIPLLLTHDIDTLQGYQYLPVLLEAEESLGLASLSLMVTHRYPWSKETLRAWARKGHRFGIHDTTHDNRLAYLPTDRIRARLQLAHQALDDMDCGAFRAPAFLRTEALYEALPSVSRIDFSSPDWALAWPHPGDGVQTPHPFRASNIVCVPTTLPRDGEVISLGLSESEVVDLWRRKSIQLWKAGAPAILLTHPDPGFTDTKARVQTYMEFLSWAKSEESIFDLSPPETLIQRFLAAT